VFEGFDGWLRIKDDSTDPSQSDELPGGERPYRVSELINHCNFILEREFDDVLVEGEVASFKINQGKWVFFDLKEDDFSLNCFMPLSQLRVAITDGMKIRARVLPKVTNWGKFSLTVRQVLPVGEGNIKKSFELLKKKLTAEGLFDPAKKRPIPENLSKIGVISSTNAAGYLDFLKILDNRWGGLEIKTINTQVQGLSAPDQIIRALDFFNQRADVEVIAILRGGGSADDLSAFNDEKLARAIAASRIPVITGIGHEIDESLADLAADVRASTPSNAAERLTPDRSAALYQIHTSLAGARRHLLDQIDQAEQQLFETLRAAKQLILQKLETAERHLAATEKVLASLNPEEILRRGYAILASDHSPDDYSSDHRRPFNQEYQIGNVVKITTFRQTLTAEIKNAQKR